MEKNNKFKKALSSNIILIVVSDTQQELLDALLLNPNVDLIIDKTKSTWTSIEEQIELENLSSSGAIALPGIHHCWDQNLGGVVIWGQHPYIDGEEVYGIDRSFTEESYNLRLNE